MYRAPTVSLQSKLSRLAIAQPGTGPAVRDASRAELLTDLRARIQSALERGAGRAPVSPPAVDTVDLPFASQATASGVVHVRMQRFSAAHRTGRARVADAFDAHADLLALLALDPGLAQCDPRRALYLDTETTGLSGGAGTVAFLVGIAWWENRTLVLEQLLVRALGEEGPMLERLRERLADASMLVTFNGKSFDMPLLRTRFVMARMPVPPIPPHLDLLHVARRVHGKRKAAGCRLVAIEREVLGFAREDDVASGDVSACYLHFLRTGEPRALLGVIEHNAWDVVALAALVGLYGEPLSNGLAPDDLAGVARTLHRAGALDRAHAVADAAVERGGTVANLPLLARARIAKARGDRAGALADYESLSAAVDEPAVRLELAKLYEHWAKAPARALEWATRGTGERPAMAKKRCDRLARKIDRALQATRTRLHDS
jgi:uncharacterized protein